jgi:AcrR family transcriptional regulator
MSEPATTRLERRKLQTRSALVAAAQQIFAERGAADVSIQQITEAADVGFGSFYNHFSSKAELFEVAVTSNTEAHASWLERLLAGESDPAVVFATSMRLTVRLLRTNPQMALIIMNSRGTALRESQGHAPHALRDIAAAVEAGRFVAEDLTLALACTAGCLVTSMQLCTVDPERSVDEVADAATLSVLRMFRMDEDEAQRIIGLPLPTEAAQKEAAGF